MEIGKPFAHLFVLIRDAEGEEDGLEGREGVLDHERGRRSLSQQSPTSHKTHHVCPSGLLDVVGGDDDSLAFGLGQGLQVLPHLLAKNRVHSNCGLVQDHEFRSMQEGNSKTDSPLLTWIMRIMLSATRMLYYVYQLPKSPKPIMLFNRPNNTALYIGAVAINVSSHKGYFIS